MKTTQLVLTLFQVAEAEMVTRSNQIFNFQHIHLTNLMFALSLDPPCICNFDDSDTHTLIWLN